MMSKQQQQQQQQQQQRFLFFQVSFFESPCLGFKKGKNSPPFEKYSFLR